MVNGKQIGLTGGRGFVGRAIKEYFIKKEYNIIDYDCDLSNFDAVKNIVSELGVPDIMIHMAGRFSGNKHELTRDNLISTWNLLEVLSQFKNVNFIFGSTGAVYGNSGQEPITESNECYPNTGYGLIKYFCEQTINQYERNTSLSSVILRFPSVYGPGNSKGVIYHWLQSILTEHRIVIHGDGSQCRSFIHVSDVCSAIFELIVSDSTGTFNVSHSEYYDLANLSSIFSEYFDFELSYAESDNDLASMILNSSKVIGETQWHPRYDIRSYVKSFV